MDALTQVPQKIILLEPQIQWDIITKLDYAVPLLAPFWDETTYDWLASKIVGDYVFFKVESCLSRSSLVRRYGLKGGNLLIAPSMRDYLRGRIAQEELDRRINGMILLAGKFLQRLRPDLDQGSEKPIDFSGDSEETANLELSNFVSNSPCYPEQRDFLNYTALSVYQGWFILAHCLGGEMPTSEELCGSQLGVYQTTFRHNPSLFEGDKKTFRAWLNRFREYCHSDLETYTDAARAEYERSLKENLLSVGLTTTETKNARLFRESGILRLQRRVEAGLWRLESEVRSFF